MSKPREILTLQFGHYSNYIGAHFWNIQELSFDYKGTIKSEVNHDILYREGQNLKGEVTYTPRLLLADLKGSLKTLPTCGGLPEEFNHDDELPWDGLEKVEQPQESKNQYLTEIDTEPLDSVAQKDYDLENNVTTWSDYLYPRFSSRTINIVKDYQHGQETETFDIYNTGQSIWKSEWGEHFSDNIRKYVEECDSMQGFQINFDSTDGFSGLGLGCIEYLADEYSKPLLVHPVIASSFPDNNTDTPEERDKATFKDSVRLVNLALSIESLSQHATMFVPLCTGEKGWRKPGFRRQFDHVDYKPGKYYHSSAILATALDTLSYRYRQMNTSYTLSDICADMTGYGRRMAAASLGLPFAMEETKYLIEHLNEVTKPIYTCITPSCKIATDKIFQLINVRGLPEHFLKAPLKEAKGQQNLSAYSCKSVAEMFQLYFQSTNFLSPTNVIVGERPLEVKTPFPKIFAKTLNRYGFVTERESQYAVESVPVVAGYHNGTFMSHMLEKLHREVGRIKFSKLHRFRDEGLEQADYQETLNRIAEFKDNYDDDMEL